MFSRIPNFGALLVAAFFLVLSTSLLTACSGALDSTPEEHIARAKDYQDRGELQAAVIELKNAIQKAPKLAEPRWLLGMIYLDTGDGPGAEKELRRAVELGVVPESAAIPLTRALQMQGKYQEVVDSTQDVGQLSDRDRNQLFALRAKSYFSLGEWDQAEALYDAILSAAPTDPQAATGKAQLAMVRGQRETARARVEGILAAHPDYAPAHSLLGRLELSNNDLEAAEKAYARAVALQESKDSNTLVMLASVHIRLERFDQAAEELRAAKQLGNVFPTVHVAEGLLHFAQKRYTEALEAFDKALTLAPAYPPSLLYGGVTNFVLGNAETARGQLNRYLALNPRNPLANRLMARIQLASGDSIEAERLVRTLVEQAPEDFFTVSLLAETLMRQGRDDEGAKLSQQLAAEHPESPEAAAEYGVALLRQDQPKAGIRELERALQLDPKNRAVRERLVLLHLNSGESDKALETARAYQEQYPEDARPYLMSGLVYLAKKEDDEAAKAFQAALEIDPVNEAANRGLATVALQQGDYVKAEAYYRQALDQAPQVAGTWINLAKLQAFRGDQAGATATLKQAVEKNPQALEPSLYLGREHLRAGEAESAVRVLEVVQPAHPDSEPLLRLLAQAQMAAGRYARANATLKQLVTMAPGDARVRFELARSYDRLNDTVKAREQLEKVVALDPTLVSAHKSLLRLALADKDADLAQARLEALRGQVAGDDLDLLVWEGQVAELKGNHPAAVAAYQQVYASRPSSSLVRRLTRAQWKSDDRAGAVQNLEFWVKGHPDDIGPQLELAQRYLDLGDTGAAIARYKQILEVSPENALALNNLASLLGETDPNAALGYAERAYTLAPGARPVVETLVAARAHAGDVKGAIRLLDKALDRRPDDATLLFRRAQLLESEGRRDEAIEALEALIRPGRAFPERKEVEAMLQRLTSGS